MLFLFFFFEIVLAVLGQMNFHVNLRMSFSVSAEKPAGISMEVALNLWIGLGNIVILTIFILAVLGHGMIFH